MSGPTKIEWADNSWNPVTGCSKVSAGCAHCYAEGQAKRFAGRAGYPKDHPFAVTLHPERLNEPLHWRKPRRIFVCSMSDLFHERVPDSFIEDDRPAGGGLVAWAGASGTGLSGAGALPPGTASRTGGGRGRAVREV